MKKINKKLLFSSLFFLGLLVSGCSTVPSNPNNSNPTKEEIVDENDYGSNSEVDLKEDDIESTFKIIDSNKNEIEESNDVYTISEAGTYTLSGKLEDKQIYVNAPELEVELVLNNVSITNQTLCPIYVLDCEEVTVKAKKGCSNYIYDYRTVDYSESEDELSSDAAIFVKNGDLKVNGTGQLSITSTHNSGIHGKDNVSVKNVTMLIKAMNNGIKGNDKVKIEENPTIGIVCGNNGIKTSNSDMGSKAQHGYVYINGGTITINSYGDGIDAAYAVEINKTVEEDGTVYDPKIDIYTNIYSSYTLESTNKSLNSGSNGQGGPGGGFGGGGFSGGSSSEKADSSAKGIKANEYILVKGGTTYINAYDDGLHTNNDVLETGETANANITIEDGTIILKVSDDGIHADGNLIINCGSVSVVQSYEGLEAQNITINGGNTKVLANDDGVNSKKALFVTNGLLDVTVSPNADKDGIDSNGTITISGGIVITRGPNMSMSAPLDADGSIKITGGTLISIGYANNRISYSNVIRTTSSNGLTSGSHSVTIEDTTIEYENSFNYSGQVVVYGPAKATIN